MAETSIYRLNDTPVLLAYAFRPFFLLTGLYGALLIAAWAGFLFGGLPLPVGISPPAWHGHEMLFGMIPAAIVGFLLTAICAWTGAAPLRGSGLLALVLLWLAGRVVMWLSGYLPLWLVAVVDLAFLPAVALYVGRVLLRHGNRRNMILTAILAVFAVANLAMHLQFMGVWPSGQRLGELIALDLAALVMIIIGGRITPAFTANWLRLQGRDASAVARSDQLDRWAMLSALLMIPADLVLAAPWLGALAALLAALVNGWRLLRWRGWHAADEPLLWVLHLGLAWIVVALLLKAAGPWFGLAPSVWMHALGVGAAGTLILGVMTRVALGHTGRPLRLPRGGVLIYYAVSLSALARLAAALGLAEYRLSVIVAALAWTFACILFVALYWPILSSPRVDGRPG
ncbi:MAG TPA: NnrS family protein [Gammaproteobacteria bacterium]|nr:NnrS family protein [Gammaproteobacteria bacterium]